MVGERSLVRVLGSEGVGKGVSAYLINRQRAGDADRRGRGEAKVSVVSPHGAEGENAGRVLAF
jgi:hypothetical protein